MPTANPTAAPAASPSGRHEPTSQLVVVLGDTSIRAFQSSGILETNLNIGVVLASTERATIGALEQQGGFRSRFPERVFPVYLKPAPDDPVSARPEMAPWVTPRPGVQHLRGGAEGALDRPDAATRLLLSHEFRSALNNGLIWAYARRPRGNHLAVAVTCFAVAGRMTGSGTLVAALDVLEDALIDFAGRADEVWIDALIGTASIHQHAKREFEDARVGSTAVIAELGEALADPATAGPSGRFGRHLGQILLLGPPNGGGTLRDLQEADASFQLALSAIVSGASQRQREALRPGANRAINERGSGARFVGIGVLEVVFDPAQAAGWVAQRLLATMPQPGGSAA
jgi:hypothetical protein